DENKFIDLILSRELYFCRMDLFPDKLEGIFPDEFLSNAPFDEKTRALIIQNIKNFFGEYKKNVFVNCWHVNEKENINMWEEYGGGKGKEGFAIKSKVYRLHNSLISDPKPRITKVEYIDQKDTVRLKSYFDNTDNLFRYKIKDDYEYENEIRAIIHLKNIFDMADELISTGSQKVMKCFRIGVSLNELIESVYLSPFGKNRDTYRKFVRLKLLQNNINAPVHFSQYKDSI
ncbi:MAG: hypothetical protein AB7G87_10730, partial [Clostridia bacterium]